MPPGRQRTTAGGSASYCSTLSGEMLTFVLVLVAVGGASHGVSSASSRVSPAGGAGHPLSAVEDPTHLSPTQILTTNNPIQVPLGRRYALVPGRDLAIQVRPGDRCTVTVLGDTDRLAMRPGRLWPSSFPCSFLPDSVTYTHLGGRQPNEDRVRLQIRYDSSSDTLIVPFTVEVDVSFVQLEVVTKNMPVVVEELGGRSDPIDNSTLHFTYDRENELCRVTVMAGAQSLPRYGQVAHSGRGNLIGQDCDDFLQSGVTYVHSAGRTSADRDWIPMTIEVIRRDGSERRQEYFQIPVRIREGNRNTPPKLTDSATLNMEVNQFILTAVTPQAVAAYDEETPAERLVFNITSPPGFEEGYIVSTADSNKPIHSFSQRDLQDLNIAYKPPSSDSNIQRIVQVRLQVVDEQGSVSAAFPLTIVVKPKNTLAPIATRNAGIQLFEGQSRPITSWQNLEVSDEDDLSEVKVKVIDGLRHGQLWVNGVPTRGFTPADLDAGVVRYSHDHSDTYSDNIIFKMVDGDRNSVEFLFPVTIYPIDDESPVLNVNVGLVTNKNATVPLSPALLSATDADSNDYDIRYKVKDAGRRLNARFTKRQMEVPSDRAEVWTKINGYYERAVTEWTQGDVDDGRVFLHHVGASRASPNHMLVERVPFTVSDDAHPPNESDLHEFVIQIIPTDDAPPALYDSSVTLQMAVDEKSMAPFTRRNLRYTDTFSNDRLLKYTLLAPPADADDVFPVPGGRLVLCAEPDTEVTSFTQAQVNHHKICYRASDQELGLSPHVIRIPFKVEDPAGNTLTDQVFSIHLRPVDNIPPRVVNNGLSVVENGQTTLGLDALDVTDPDTPPDGLRIVLTRRPRHGDLTLDGAPVVDGQVLSPIYVSNGRLAYRSRPREEAEEDVFTLDVTDGTHHVPVSVSVRVRLVDDERPSIVLPQGKLGIALSVPENREIQISSQELRARDPDTDDLDLIFTVEGGPYQGVVVVDGRPRTAFRQRDVVEGRVYYRHTAGEIGQTEQVDVFNLTVSDRSKDWVGGGGSYHLTGVTVSVIILPSDDRPPTVSTNGVFRVREGSTETLNANHITIIDPDTPHNHLRCSIMTQPSFGYLENITPQHGSEKSRKGKRIEHFTANDLVSNHINYVQNHHKGIEPTDDHFMFQCSDLSENASPIVAFSIVIEPTNDEVPELFAREFIVQEGGSLIVDVPILTALDADRPADELLFTVSQSPVHGSIIQHKVTETRDITTFRMADLAGEGSILYEHDDSETTQDSFRIQVSDGKHRVEKDIMVIIIPVDDETPRLTINTGLDIQPGETKLITNDELKATDLDSPDSNITFSIRRLPVYGYIQKEVNGVFQNMSRGMTFKQRDIDGKLIRYQQTGRSDVRDLIKLDVTDGHNALIDRYFYLTIEGVDDSYPEVINRGVELPEGGSVVLTTDLLSSTDSQTDVAHLRFTITRPPTHGHLENTDSPGVPISSFTQLDLAGNKIRYVHVGEEESSMDSFAFEVTDGRHHVWRTLRVSVSPVDNKKPVLMLERLKVLEAGEKVITPFELRAMDSDSADGRLEFWVTTPPLHGQLLHNHSQVASQFTMSDINENLISYKHDGSESTADSFMVRLTDGTHHDFYVFPETKRTTWRAQRVELDILPVDNGVPFISVNAGGTELQELVGLGVGVELSPRVLVAGDRDSPPDQLVYTVTHPPTHGDITNINTGRAAISEWTQGEMSPGWIVYLLRPGTNVTEDHFVFKVTDPGGNEVGGQRFSLRWAWLALDAPSIDADEDQGDLEVKVKRRGSLEHTAFVTVTAVDGTALAGQDFEMPPSAQVQLAPGEEEKVFRLRLVSDGVYEATEYFTLQLHSPVSAALEAPLAATVRINDSRDESVVSVGVARLEVREDTGEALVPLLRTGDVSDELQVVCFTTGGSATGTVPHAVTSFSDYITRSRDHYSIIRFDKGEHNVFCPVTVIDDSLYEGEETFYVYLGDPLGGQLGPQNRTEVVILKDEEDEPVVYFGRQTEEVDESVGDVEVLVWRAGTDLSRHAHVTVRSRPHPDHAHPDHAHPAQVGVDYVGVHHRVHFGPGESLQQLRVEIVDDLGVVSLEGSRTFQLVLTMPDNVTLGDPSTTTININDSLSDLPHLRFKQRTHTAGENEGTVTVVVERSGDLSFATSVRCYTRQASATVSDDFAERPDTDASLVTFMPGQREADCTVRILADEIHEGDEKFYLVLGTPRSSAPGGARLNPPSRTTITVTDDADKSVIMFGETRFVIREPLSIDRVTRVTLPVVRLGDTSLPAVVRVYTRDGTARAAKDYIGFSKELTFDPGVTSQEVEVVILYDDEVELREAFTVLITHDRNRVAKVKNARAVVFVEEMTGWADVTFPSPPIVVSLRDYDKVDSSPDQPPAGYPLICVTACDPRYPDYKAVTSALCQREGVNNSLTQYRWRVAPPPGPNGLTPDLHDLETNTFFTSVNSVTLDSIFISAGSQVSCAARAVNRGGEPGLELSSRVVTVSTTDGVCPAREAGSVGAERFVATITHTGPEDREHPNMVAVRVRIPHRDGLIPVISTQPITNLEFALSDSAYRVAQHVCSNLLTPAEVGTSHGFVDDHATSTSTSTSSPWAHRLPYENDVRLRTNNTVNFYRALDLESCVWQFEGYYGLSELVTMCGGSSSAVGQVLDLTQSFLTVSVPLYVSYVYFSASLLRQWAHYDVDTTLRLTFVYNTAITWQRAVMPAGGGLYQGRLHPMRMQINSEGRLVVTLESEALFRGQFVPSYPGTGLQSAVSCPDKPRITFALNLLRSDSTYEQPRQTWQFTSDLVESDYTCTYTVSLVPCLVSRGQAYTPQPPACRPHSPVTFSLPLRLQQVNQPVAANLTLEGRLGVWRKRSAWLTAATGGGEGEGETDPADITFTPDDTIYGLVRLGAEHQAPGPGFRVSLEKVFVCTGVEGAVPHYDPPSGQYGCLGPNGRLLHTIRVLDKGAPAAINTRFQGADFEARFIEQDPKSKVLAKMAGLDGFSFSAKPLFKVDPGHHWFLHVIYTVEAASKHQRGRRETAMASGQGAMISSNPAAETRHLLRHSNQQLSAAPSPAGLSKQTRMNNKSPLVTSKILSSTRPVAAAAALVAHRFIEGSTELFHFRRHRRGLPDEASAQTGTGTNMLVIALDYSNTIHSSRLYSDRGDEGKGQNSGPQVALVAGLSTAFIVLVATILVAITVARYNCIHEEDSCDSDSSCHDEAAPNLPPPPPPPPSVAPQNQQLCGKVTQV